VRETAKPKGGPTVKPRSEDGITKQPTLTPLYTETLTSTQGSLSTGDQRLHFNGVDPQACIFRG
jgi:hypothetical protein